MLAREGGQKEREHARASTKQEEESEVAHPFCCSKILVELSKRAGMWFTATACAAAAFQQMIEPLVPTDCNFGGCAKADYKTCGACSTALKTQSSCQNHKDATGDQVCAWESGANVLDGICVGCDAVKVGVTADVPHKSECLCLLVFTSLQLPPCNI